MERDLVKKKKKKNYFQFELRTCGFFLMTIVMDAWAMAMANGLIYGF